MGYRKAIWEQTLRLKFNCFYIAKYIIKSFVKKDRFIFREVSKKLLFVLNENHDWINFLSLHKHVVLSSNIKKVREVLRIFFFTAKSALIKYFLGYKDYTFQ